MPTCIFKLRTPPKQLFILLKRLVQPLTPIFTGTINMQWAQVCCSVRYITMLQIFDVDKTNCGWLVARKLSCHKRSDVVQTESVFIFCLFYYVVNY